MQERIESLQQEKENESRLVLQQKNELYKKWIELEDTFKFQRHTEKKTRLKDIFLEKIDMGIKTSGKDYILVIKGLSIEDKNGGTGWLQGIVDSIIAEALKIIPSFS